MQKKLEAFLREQKAELSAPSIKIQAFHRGNKKIDITYGLNYKFYDLASLTKVIFTTTRLMMLKEAKIFDESKLINFTDFNFNLTSFKLLTHSAGFKPTKQFFKKIEVKYRNSNWKQIKKLINQETPEEGKILYSDIGFLILMDVIEKLDNLDTYESWIKVKNKLNLDGVDFNVNNEILENAAPCGMCYFRKKISKGVVNDANTYILGGVSTHAGLFGTIDGVSNWMLALRQSLLGKGVLNEVSYFTKRHLGDWGLGFMKPALDGNASCGKYMKDAFGHLGFTGTSVWFDPKLDIGIVILSNRLQAKQKTLFAALRPKIHDKIIELIHEHS